MIKFENTVNPSPEQWRAVIMGVRNPLESWEKSDSGHCKTRGEDCVNCAALDKNEKCTPCIVTGNDALYFVGKNDLGLMMRLRNAGTDHRKFMRMIVVYVDIIAPLYWYKEADQYKVGTVTNSCSTMHCIHKKEFTLEDFSTEHLIDDPFQAFSLIDNSGEYTGFDMNPKEIIQFLCNVLNYYRQKYLETKDKKYWWQMIQLLPSSYNQKRTFMLNYEVLANIYKSRRGHKLDEWKDFCEWIESLPYAEIITGKMQQTNNT